MKNIYKCAFILSALLVMAACVDKSAPTGPRLTPDEILQRIEVFPSAAVLAVGDSIQLGLKAYDLLDKEMSTAGEAPIVWTSSNDDIAVVDSNGIVHAHSPTTEFVSITGRWNHNGKADSAVTTAIVTPSRSSIAGLRIVPKDSARTASNDQLLSAPASWFAIVATDDNGQAGDKIRLPITIQPGLPITAVIAIYVGALGSLLGGDDFFINTTYIGDYYLYVSANVYGVDIKDSTKFTGLHRAAETFPITLDQATGSGLTSRNYNREIIMQPCGHAKFHNQSQVPIAVEFSDPSKASGCVTGDLTGNIESIPPGRTIIRKFPQTGTIEWAVRDLNTGQLQPKATGKITMRNPN